MIQTVEKSEIIKLTPNKFDNILYNLYEKVNEKLHTCSKDEGYVLKIEQDLKIIDNQIERITGNVLYNVKYTVELFHPQENETYRCIVKHVFKEGVFCIYKNCFHILVPENYLDGWEFQEKQFQKEDSIIQENSVVSVSIISIRYINQNYQAIGTLI